MKNFIALLMAFPAGLLVSAAPYRPDTAKQLGFPIYTNAPVGKQLSGEYAPATTPAQSPEETQKKFKVPPGFEVRLFASEPEVVNPVAMTWDERGRLWVLELYEYPMGAPKGKKGRDRIEARYDEYVANPGGGQPLNDVFEIGLPWSLSIGFGSSLVSSRMRVPLPAARVTAFI